MNRARLESLSGFVDEPDFLVPWESCKVHVEENGGKNGELSDYTVVSLFYQRAST